MADKAWYEVPVRGHTMTAKYTAEEAEALYGDDAKQVGDAKQAEPQPVTRPPYDTGEVRDPADEQDDEPAKKAPAPKNKARGVSDSK